MKIVKAILVAALAWAACYLNIGFVLMEFNPAEWAVGARALLAVWGGALAFTAATLYRL